MSTMQTIVDRARIPLNDAAKIRYTDAMALEFANAAIFRAYQIRPDLKFGSYSTAYAALALGDTFPLPDAYLQAVADYVTGRCNTIDAEPENGNRSMEFMVLFEKELTS